MDVTERLQQVVLAGAGGGATSICQESPEADPRSSQFMLRASSEKIYCRSASSPQLEGEGTAD